MTEIRTYRAGLFEDRGERKDPKGNTFQDSAIIDHEVVKLDDLRAIAATHPEVTVVQLLRTMGLWSRADTERSGA